MGMRIDEPRHNEVSSQVEVTGDEVEARLIVRSDFSEETCLSGDCKGDVRAKVGFGREEEGCVDRVVREDCGGIWRGVGGHHRNPTNPDGAGIV